MKISIDARGANWYKGTGIGTYTENILNNIINIDKTNSYHIYWSGEGYTPYYKDNCKIIMCSKKYHRFFEENYFPYNTFKEGVDIFHIPQNGIGLNENIKCKKVVTIHDLIPYIMPETVGRGYLLKFLREVPRIIQLSDGILTVSQWSKKDILKFFPIDPNKIIVTPLAANENYKPLDKKWCKDYVKKRFDVDKPFILYIGGFSRRKNVKGLISAFINTYESYNEETCLLIGGGYKEEGQILYKYVKDIGFSEKIIFTGFIDDKELPILYNGCKCFVYPSFYEGFGLPPLEAMSCGAPVIASNNTSIPEVVDDAGILIDPFCINSLEEALLKVINDDSLRNKLSEKSLERASLFSWEKTAKKTIAAYETIYKSDSSI